MTRHDILTAIQLAPDVCPHPHEDDCCPNDGLCEQCMESELYEYEKQLLLEWLGYHGFDAKVMEQNVDAFLERRKET